MFSLSVSIFCVQHSVGLHNFLCCTRVQIHDLCFIVLYSTHMCGIWCIVQFLIAARQAHLPLPIFHTDTFTNLSCPEQHVQNNRSCSLLASLEPQTVDLDIYFSDADRTSTDRVKVPCFQGVMAFFFSKTSLRYVKA